MGILARGPNEDYQIQKWTENFPFVLFSDISVSLFFDQCYNQLIHNNIPTLLQLHFIADKNVSCGKIPPSLEDIHWPHPGLKTLKLFFASDTYFKTLLLKKMPSEQLLQYKQCFPRTVIIISFLQSGNSILG